MKKENRRSAFVEPTGTPGVVPLTLLLVMLSAVFPFLLQAQESETPVEEPVPDRIIVTAEAPETTAGPAPGVLVLELEDLRQEGDVTLADVLRRVSGIDLQRRGSGFESATVRIRGSDGEQVLVLRDGRSLSDSRSSLTDLSLISLDGIERIEIVLGPATAMYGAGGAAGVINLISSDTDRAPEGLTGSARLLWGSFGEYRAEAGGTLVRGGKDRRTVLDMSASGVYAENTYGYERSGMEETRENAGGKDGSVRIALDTAGEVYRLGLDGALSAFRRGLPGSVEFPAKDAELTEGKGVFILHGGLGDDRNEHPEAWSIDAEAGITRTDRSYRDPAYPLGALESDSSLTLLSGSLVFSGPAGAFSLNMPLAVRAEYLEDTGLGSRNRLVASASPSAGTVLGLGRAGEMDLNIFSRFEMIRPSEDILLPSVRFTAGWTAAEIPLWLGAVAATGYRLPDFSELFLERSAFAVGNPDLQPEQSRSVEVELRAGDLLVRPTAGGGQRPLPVGLRIAGHLTDYEYLIQWLPDPNGYWRPRNTGSALIWGAEVDLEFLTPLGLSPWTIDGRVGADILKALDRNEGVTWGKQLPYRAALALRAGCGLEHLLGHRLSIALDGRGARPVTRQNTVWLDPYLNIDLGASVALLSRRMFLSLAVRNLLNEEFLETRFYPNPGREVRVTLEVRK